MYTVLGFMVNWPFNYASCPIQSYSVDDSTAIHSQIIILDLRVSLVENPSLSLFLTLLHRASRGYEIYHDIVLN